MVAAWPASSASRLAARPVGGGQDDRDVLGAGQFDDGADCDGFAAAAAAGQDGDFGGQGGPDRAGLLGARSEPVRPHGDCLLNLERHVPTVTIVIDTAERIFTAFDIIDELTKERGLVTGETVLAVRAGLGALPVGRSGKRGRHTSQLLPARWVSIPCWMVHPGRDELPRCERSLQRGPAWLVIAYTPGGGILGDGSHRDYRQVT